MELTSLPEIPYDEARRLRDAGAGTVGALAATTDIAGLAARSGLAPELVEQHRASARHHVERLLGEAGVRGEDDLLAADPATIAAATGLALEDVQAFQRAARAVTIPVQGPAGPDRVVLLEGAPKARIVARGRVVESAPIVAGRFAEDADDALARAGANAVWLADGAVVAVARVDEQTVRELPIYKLDGGAETRVRIKEIRVKGAPAPQPAPAPTSAPVEPPAKKGFFGKLLGRK